MTAEEKTDDADVDRDASTTTTATMDAPVTANERRTITLGLRITHASANVPSLAHLMETHEIEVDADGADTAADVKRKLAAKAGVPAHELCLRWFDNVIGREHVGQDVSIDDRDTLAKFNIPRWLEKFPHWRCTLALLDPAPRDPYEAIHTATAIHKGIKDVDKYVDDLRGTDDWTDLVK